MVGAGDDAFCCPTCLDFFVDPVTVCPCGHSFCSHCLLHWLEVCPTGRRACALCTSEIEQAALSYSLRAATEAVHGAAVAQRRAVLGIVRLDAFRLKPPSAVASAVARWGVADGAQHNALALLPPILWLLAAATLAASACRLLEPYGLTRDLRLDPHAFALGLFNDSLVALTTLAMVFVGHRQLGFGLWWRQQAARAPIDGEAAARGGDVVAAEGNVAAADGDGVVAGVDGVAAGGDGAAAGWDIARGGAQRHDAHPADQPAREGRLHDLDGIRRLLLGRNAAAQQLWLIFWSWLGLSLALFVHIVPDLRARLAAADDPTTALLEFWISWVVALPKLILIVFVVTFVSVVRAQAPCEHPHDARARARTSTSTSSQLYTIWHTHRCLGRRALFTLCLDSL